LNFCTEDTADHEFGAGLGVAIVAKRASLLTGADQVSEKAAKSTQHVFEFLRKFVVGIDRLDHHGEDKLALAVGTRIVGAQTRYLSERVCGVLGGVDLCGDGGFENLNTLFDRGEEKLILVAEMIVEGALGDAGGSRDPIDRRPGEPVTAEAVDGGPEKSLFSGDFPARGWCGVGHTKRLVRGTDSRNRLRVPTDRPINPLMNNQGSRTGAAPAVEQDERATVVPQTSAAKVLRPDRLGPEIEGFRASLSEMVIGQEPAVEAVTQAFQIYRAGLASSERPLGSFLFLGPTGTGKTNLVESIVESCFGDRKAMLKIDCAEFSHSHEVARLIGSPPGYLGHQETNPYLSTANITRNQTPECPFTVILFDEIEKANDSLWQLLLGILDKGRLTLGTNKEVDLSRCFIFLTSNIGSRSVSDILAPGMGFVRETNESDEKIHQRIEDAVLWSAKRTFAPEFLNRLDHKVVFQRLTTPEMRKILDLELRKIENRLGQRGDAIEFIYTDRAIDRLLEAGTDSELGARPMKRILEQHLVFPLARLYASEQLLGGETVCVDWLEGQEEIEFSLAERKRATG
jgi:ATP-dependent Clp protease ATP-binding subunit ClpB